MGLMKTRSCFLLGQTLTLNLAGPLVKLTKGLEKSSPGITGPVEGRRSSSSPSLLLVPVRTP